MSAKDSKGLTMQNEVTESLFYIVPDGGVKAEVILHDKIIWLTQQSMTVLIEGQRAAITKCLKNIYEPRELDEESTSSVLEHRYQTRKVGW